MKYLSGSTSPIARSTCGYLRVGPNDPERKAIGSRMKLTTADEPSEERIRPAAARPIAAKTTVPSRTASRSDAGRVGRCAPKKIRPTAQSATASRTKTISEDTTTHARYVAAGSGVDRIRFRIPYSRRFTSEIAVPANAVFAAP